MEDIKTWVYVAVIVLYYVYTFRKKMLQKKKTEVQPAEAQQQQPVVFAEKRVKKQPVTPIPEPEEYIETERVIYKPLEITPPENQSFYKVPHYSTLEDKNEGISELDTRKFVPNSQIKKRTNRYAAIFNTPSGIRDAFVAGEIFKRVV